MNPGAEKKPPGRQTWPRPEGCHPVAAVYAARKLRASIPYCLIL
jgi:hypothetical protein